MKIVYSLFLLLILGTNLYSQVDTTRINSDIENILEDQSTDRENLEYYDNLEFLISNPIHLNTASINELLVIPFLDRPTATAIIRHRNLMGGIYNEDQLKYVQGVSNDLIYKIIPFLELGDAEQLTFFDSIESQFSDVKLSLRSRIIQDIQEEQAYKNDKYPGSSIKLYNRLVISKDKNIRFGILTEKDPGENSFNDLTVFNLTAKEIGVVKTIVLGDYNFEFGQGLALWSRYGLRKGSDAVGILPRNAAGIRPFLSAEENIFLRGAAASIALGSFQINTFFSYKKLDASIDTLTNQIKAFSVDGFHRTDSEIRRNNTVQETVVGSSIQYFLNDNIDLGLLFYNTSFDKGLQNAELNDPSGKSFNYVSLSYNAGIDRITFNGETSISNNKIVTINNLGIRLNKEFAVSFSYRNYDSKYWVLHAAGFGERDDVRNESGFYTGLHWGTIIGNFDFYYDQYKFPTASSNFPFAAKGNDYMFYYSFKPLKTSEVRVRYKNETRDDIVVMNGEYGISPYRNESLRGEITYQITKNLTIRSRAEYTSFFPSIGNNIENGFLYFQDLKYSPIKSLQFSARIIFFNTDSYNSRVYEFENDLSGLMTNPALYGEGSRWYFIGKYSTTFGLSLSLKYSELRKPGVRFIGSGDTLIEGNVDNRLSFQLDYSF